jgi:hypothetical protein
MDCTKALTDKEEEFLSFFESRRETYGRLKKRYKVGSVKGVHYIRSGGEEFLISNEDFLRVLEEWRSAAY